MAKETKKNTNSSLKLSENNTLRLLQLYQSEPCLYDVNSEAYGNRKLRAAATKRIVTALSVGGFGPREVSAKFKNLRNSYSQELKKIKNSEESGAEKEDVYVPKVYWFNVMDSFLRPYLYSRPPHLVLKQKIQMEKEVTSEHRWEESNQEENEDSIFNQVEATYASDDQSNMSFIHANENESNSSHRSLQEEVEDGPSYRNNHGPNKEAIPVYTFQHQHRSSLKQNSVETSVRKVGGMNMIRKKRCISLQKTTSPKSSPKKAAILTAVDKLHEVAKLTVSMTSKKRDMYDHFGDYVASVLREAGEQRAMIMQHEISNVLFKHMIGSSS